jgi:arabinofuranosyltransferase
MWLPDRARWFEPQSELSFPGDSHDHSYRWFGNYFVDRLAVAARYLETHAPRGSLVASTPAGSIAYYMNHRVIDMLGLTDRHIARTAGIYQGEWQYGRAGHEKGDGPYVLSRAPDFILMGNVAVLPFPLDERSMATKLVFKSEHELWAEPEFHARYELVSVRLADSGPFQYFTFYRRKP